MLEEHSLDSFLLSKRRDGNSERDSNYNQIDSKNRQNDNKSSHNNSNQGKQSSNSKNSSDKSQKYKYMLFVWNGKNTGATVKAQTLPKGYALDEYL